MVNNSVQWLVGSLVALLHPFFVTVIDINHNAKESTAEISIRMFTDDLEKTLMKYQSPKLDLQKPNNIGEANKQITNYIEKNLKLKINGQPVQTKFIGFEIIKESTWSYFEVTGVKELSKLEVDCSLLHDFENSQINIFHVKSKGQEKSFKLDYPQRVANFSF